VVKMSRSKLFILGLCMDSCDLLYVLNPFEQEKPEFLGMLCAVLRIRDVYPCYPTFSILDLGSASKNLSI
jgi:hypothetical protein